MTSQIRRLPEGTINRIAAGEVIERPANVVKELVENAIDAGAQTVEVVFRDGGRTFMRVNDDGDGMSPSDIELAIERHATSKIADDDLVHIATLGFRGEALPSIAAVSRMRIVSRARGAGEAYSLDVEGGGKGTVKPAALGHSGTVVEVRDLFYAVPARLKFLRSERSETAEAIDTVRRLALAHPGIAFSFVTEAREVFVLRHAAAGADGWRDRLQRLVGEEFIANAAPLSGVAGRVRNHRFRRPAHLPPRSIKHAVRHGERPAGSRPADPGRHPGRLCRRADARPVSGRGASYRLSRPRSRRQRPSD